MAAAQTAPQPVVVEAKPPEPEKALVQEFASDSWDAIVGEVVAENAELLRRLSKLRRVRFAGVVFPSVANVERAHDVVLSKDGGLAGVRDAGLLESAVMAPRSGYYDSLAELAAALCLGLAKNHPFLDGNKRVAIVVALGFLRGNGRHFEPDVDRWYEIVDGLAAGRVSREALVQHFTALMGGDPFPFEELRASEASQVCGLLERRPELRRHSPSKSYARPRRLRCAACSSDDHSSGAIAFGAARNTSRKLPLPDANTGMWSRRNIPTRLFGVCAVVFANAGTA